MRANWFISAMLAALVLTASGCVGSWKVSRLAPEQFFAQKRPPLVQVVHRMNDGQTGKIVLWYPIVEADTVMGFAYKPQRQPKYRAGERYGTDAIPLSRVVSVATDEVDALKTSVLWVGGFALVVAASGVFSGDWY